MGESEWKRVSVSRVGKGVGCDGGFGWVGVGSKDRVGTCSLDIDLLNVLNLKCVHRQ